MLKGVVPTEMRLVSQSQTEFCVANNQYVDPHLQIWLAKEIILHAAIQYDYKKCHDKSIANPKLQYNYSNNNYIAELLRVNSCWNGVNILPATSVTH